MQATGENFERRSAVTRAGNLFTTHTAVAAGFDRFPPALVEQCLGDYARRSLGISLAELLALGRENPIDAAEDFNMAYLGIRGSGCSERREPTARRGEPPSFPASVSALARGRGAGRARDQWCSHAELGFSGGGRRVDSGCGQGRWLRHDGDIEQGIRKVPDAELWRLRNVSRQALVDFARERLVAGSCRVGALPPRRSNGATDLRSQRTDAGLRAPVCGLQASQAAVARSPRSCFCSCDSRARCS